MQEDARAFGSFYVLDAQDQLLDWGGPTWDSFASDNGGTALAAQDLKGDLIYDHIAGHFTKRFLRQFFAQARAEAQPIARTYRCDSPRLKRLMEMTARPLSEGALSVEHRLVSETPMPVEIAFHEDAGARKAAHLRCSICNRLRRVGAGAWREPERCVESGGPLKVVHTVCTECRGGLGERSPLRPIRAA